MMKGFCINFKGTGGFSGSAIRGEGKYVLASLVVLVKVDSPKYGSGQCREEKDKDENPHEDGWLSSHLHHSVSNTHSEQ